MLVWFYCISLFWFACIDYAYDRVVYYGICFLSRCYIIRKILTLCLINTLWLTETNIISHGVCIEKHNFSWSLSAPRALCFCTPSIQRNSVALVKIIVDGPGKFIHGWRQNPRQRLKVLCESAVVFIREWWDLESEIYKWSSVLKQSKFHESGEEALKVEA